MNPKNKESNLPVKTLDQILSMPPTQMNAEEKEIYDSYQEDLQEETTSTTTHVFQPSRLEVASQLQFFKTPDEQTHKKLDMIIITSLMTRQFWEEGIDDGRLFCQSIGAKFGVPTEDGVKEFGRYVKFNQTYACETCPIVVNAEKGLSANDFKSSIVGSKKGKACKEQRRLLVLVDGFLQPMKLVVPPSSIVAYDIYRSNQHNAGRTLASIWTTITLHKAEGGGNVWSLFDFVGGERLPTDLYKTVKEFKVQFAESLGIEDEEEPPDYNTTVDPPAKDPDEMPDFLKS